MDDSKQRAVKFLEKEIRTYMALSIFLSKKDIKEQVQVGEKKILINPAFYKERIKEARNIIHDLCRATLSLGLPVCGSEQIAPGFPANMDA